MFQRNSRDSSSRGSTNSYSPRSRSFSSAPRSGSGFSSRGPSRGGFRGATRGNRYDKKIDVSVFVRKAKGAVAPEVYVPKHAFVDFAVDARLKQNIVNKGYVTPTPIQDQAIPVVLEGRDIVGIANTGTGKTAAFLIPLIDKVLRNRKENILVMVPTRELAIQIEQELRKFTEKMNIFSVCVVGGAPIGYQIRQLRYQNNFIIGTPGRIKDLIDRKVINLSEFATVVLDEADRMLDMGFVNDMRLILGLMPKPRHTLFFSATLSRDIEILIKDFLNNPVTVSVKTGDTAANVDQDIVQVMQGDTKIELLHDLLTKEDFNKVLIFSRTKHGADKLSRDLTSRGFSSDSIHGDKNHAQRQRALGAFKTNMVKVLVATDVAARGLDIPNVSHVINYDVPATHEDYIHRIGRTGRGGEKGKALTFVE